MMTHSPLRESRKSSFNVFRCPPFSGCLQVWRTAGLPCLKAWNRVVHHTRGAAIKASSPCNNSGRSLAICPDNSYIHRRDISDDTCADTARNTRKNLIRWLPSVLVRMTDLLSPIQKTSEVAFGRLAYNNGRGKMPARKWPITARENDWKTSLSSVKELLSRTEAADERGRPGRTIDPLFFRCVLKFI